MKSSERARTKLSDALHAVLVLLSAVVIGWKQPGLTASFAKLRVNADDYLLPDPNVTLVVSLGYRSALADFIFGHVLVSHGLHFQEKRLFEHVGEYLDAINLLDPKFRDPYRFADTLLTMQPKSPPQAFYRKARQIQERGLQELPYDQELWSTAGQYMAYLAAPWLKDPAESAEFKRVGAQYLMHACDLIGSNQNIPYQCITAANLLTKQGDRDAARRFLQRLLIMSDDPEIRDLALRKLSGIANQEDIARAKRREQRYIVTAIREGMAFLSPIERDAIGPGTDTTACAGNEAESSESCASSWRRLDEHLAEAEEAAP
ncbi:MAG TPA: hypothetical protein VHB79_38650 [Polyangiaceae bacterium]|nr:hypothetical protein [Polyangiaceae bacterium]